MFDISDTGVAVETRNPLRRRSFLAAALSSVAAVSACGDLAPGETTTSLRYWNLFSGGDGETMKKMLDSYRAAHPRVELEDVTLEWGDRYYTKLAMASAADRAPDVAILHLGRLPAFAPGGLIDPVRPDLLRQTGIRAGQFPPGLWRRSHYGNRLFAIPLDTHPFVLYYNVDVCRKAGLLDGNGRLRQLDGEQSVRSALRAAKRVTGAYGVVFESAGSEAVVPWRLFWTLYRQLDGRMFTSDGKALALHEGKLSRVLEFLQDLGRSGLSSTGMDGDAAIAQFSSGRAGFLWHGEWEVQTFLTSGTPFSMTRFPPVFGRPVAEADSHAFVLPHQEDRQAERHRLIYEFVAAMVRQSALWAEGGHIPAYLPVTESSEYAALQPQSRYRSVIDDVELDPEVWFAGSGSRLWMELSPVLGAVMDGRLSVRQGIAELREVTQRLLDTPNPTS
ncbi:MAG: extracellular solute-binding protein [Pseudonocardiaceae bacterium]|nr:extracellular solute-binding protein [Pseudonocardiaceae bacterium]